MMDEIGLIYKITEVQTLNVCASFFSSLNVAKDEAKKKMKI